MTDARFVTTQVEVEGRVETRVVEVSAQATPAWGADARLSAVGQPGPRVDGPAKVTGRAAYTSDVTYAGMLHAVLVRAHVPCGRVVSMDRQAARLVPGVVDVIDAGDLPRPVKAVGLPLFGPDVRYAGQPVAAVLGESLTAARAGAMALDPVIDPAPFVLSVDEAMEAGAPVAGQRGSTLGAAPVLLERGDVAAGLRAAAHVLTREYHTPSALHCAMEPHGAVAHWDGTRLTIHESTQGVFRVRDQVASALGIPRSDVRVIMEHMGGGFGAKNHAGAHTFAAALFARRSGRPVSCVLDRHGEQSDTGHRPQSRHVVTLGADGEGHLLAVDAVIDITLGAAGWEASAASFYHQMYSCRNVRTRETMAYVHQQPMQAFRAPGQTEGAFALERSMDVLAREMGMDPLELRRRNFAPTDEEKNRPYSSNRLLECYEEGARRFGWESRERRRNGPAAAEAMGLDPSSTANFPVGGPPHRTTARGFGMASQVWGAGGGPPAYASVRLNSDGSIAVHTGTQDLGTGARTVLAQIAADAIGARLRDVTVEIGDTGRDPYAGNSWGSMTTPSVGPAVHAAGHEVRQRILEAAGEVLRVDPRALSTEDSTVNVVDGDVQLTFRDLARRLGNVMIMGHGSRGPNPPGVGLMTFGAQFAEVEVDRETGVVRVTRIVAVHDAGRIINPLLATSQMAGGILMGLGFALFEERLVDRASGRPVNPSLHEYKIPTFGDVPAIDASCLDVADPLANSVGARGLAEPPLIPTAPAIANAVADALGVEVDEIPLAPWRVLAALGRA